MVRSLISNRSAAYEIIAGRLDSPGHPIVGSVIRAVHDVRRTNDELTGGLGFTTARVRIVYIVCVVCAVYVTPVVMSSVSQKTTEPVALD